MPALDADSIPDSSHVYVGTPRVHSRLWEVDRIVHINESMRVTPIGNESIVAGAGCVSS